MSQPTSKPVKYVPGAPAQPSEDAPTDTAVESVDQRDAAALGDGGQSAASETRPKEIGGRKGPEPTRYGDWEKNGRCIDF